MGRFEPVIPFLVEGLEADTRNAEGSVEDVERAVEGLTTGGPCVQMASSGIVSNGEAVGAICCFKAIS